MKTTSKKFAVIGKNSTDFRTELLNFCRYYIKWIADNDRFIIVETSADGRTCTVTPSESGDTVFTATVYDADDNLVSSDEQVMTSKAGFFMKIFAFFKKLFGLTKTIPQVYKNIF